MIRRLEKYIYSSIKRRMIVQFIVAALLPMLILQVLSFYFNQEATKRIVINSTETASRSTLMELEEIFKESRTLCESIQKNASFQERMRSDYEGSRQLFAEELLGDQDLETIVAGKKEIYGLYLLGNNGFCSKSNAVAFKYRDYTSERWYTDTIGNQQRRWYGFHDRSYVSQSMERGFISYCAPFIDSASGNANGVMVVEITKDVVNSLVDANIIEEGIFFLVDSSGKLIYQTSDSGMDLFYFIEKLKETMDEDGRVQNLTLMVEGNLLVCNQSDESHWIMCQMVPKGYINQNGNLMLLIMVFFMIAAAFFATVIATQSSQYFFGIIEDIQQAMKALEEGDLTVRLDVNGEDESADIASGFNHMAERMQSLVNSIYENQMMLRKQELRALQAQINPHFLYNSLDSIVWMLRLERKEDAVEVLHNLTTLFRIALSNGHEMITVRSEILHVQSYLRIQSLRYSKKFTYEVHADESLMDYVTLKLLLQPLVENSIYHAISFEKPRIKIDISVTEKGDHLIFIVEDDGAGMNGEQLRNLQEKMSMKSDAEEVAMETKTGGYGLKNVDERLKIYFGEEYGLQIDSTEDRGTIIRLVLPKRRMEEEIATEK